MVEIRSVVNIFTYIIAFIGIVPLAGEVSVIYPIIFLCFAVYGAWAEAKNFSSVPRVWLNILSVLIILFTISRMTMDNMVIPALEALIAIQAIKFIEPHKKFRDFMQIYMIATFMAAGSALLSLSIWFIVLVFALFLLISVSMVLLTFMTEDEKTVLSVRHIRRLVLKTIAIPLLSIPVAVLLFAVLPRTNYPLFQFLNREDGIAVGFSDKVELGNVSSIQEDAGFILRAEMPEVKGGALPYWRGIVMDSFDGQIWSASDYKGRTAKVRQPKNLIEQKIYLEAYGDKYLFGMDIPFNIDISNAERKDGLVYVLNSAVSKRIYYSSFSSDEKYLIEEYSDYDRFLNLPELSDNLKKFVAGFSNTESPEKLGELMQVYFIRNGFKYSTQKLPLSKSPLDDFLFDLKAGNCEYYASAAAVVLRANGVPARLVGGYIGGYYNDAGGYYAVPQRNAHVWVEAHIDGKGWVRVDPTPSQTSFSSGGVSLTFRMRMMADAVNFYWNAFVINYDFAKQVKAVKSIRNAANELKTDYKKLIPDLFEYLPYILAAVLTIIFLLFFRFFKIKGDKRFADSYRKLMKEKGYNLSPDQGLTQADIKEPELKAYCDEFISIFHGAYYRERKLTIIEKKRLKALLSEIKSFRAL